MNERVQTNILSILRRAQPLVKKEDILKLKMLSNETIHDASILQDTDSISVSIIIFSLAKILNRPRLVKTPAIERFKQEIIKELEAAKTSLEQQNETNYKKTIQRIFQKISTFEKKFSMYLTEVLEHAKIKRGGRIYEHGLSVGRTAGLLGISTWELLSYLGETKINASSKENQLSAKYRMNITRRLFSQ